jgi:hypothetical protein
MEEVRWATLGKNATQEGPARFHPLEAAALIGGIKRK